MMQQFSGRFSVKLKEKSGQSEHFTINIAETWAFQVEKVKESNSGKQHLKLSYTSEKMLRRISIKCLYFSLIETAFLSNLTDLALENLNSLIFSLTNLISIGRLVYLLSSFKIQSIVKHR